MKYFYNKFFFRTILLGISLLLIGKQDVFGQTGFKGNTTYIVNGDTDRVAPVDTFYNLTGPSAGPAYGLISYLNSFGIDYASAQGQITFLLTDGYSGIEPNIINIGGAGGWPNMFANSTRPIVLKPATGKSFNITTTATISSNKALVSFNGAWFFTIDGQSIDGQRNLSFRMPTTAATNTRVVDFMPTTSQKCQYIGIKNCQIVGINSVATQPTFAGVYLGGATSNSFVALSRSENLFIINNEILGTINGIFIKGRGNAQNNFEKNITITDNIIGGYSTPQNNNQIFSENFEQNTGTEIAKSGWTQVDTAASNPIKVVNSGLSYTGYEPSGIGNTIYLNRSGQKVYKNAANDVNSGSLYASCIIRDSLAGSGNYFMGLIPRGSTTPIGRLHIKTGANPNHIFTETFNGTPGNSILGSGWYASSANDSVINYSRNAYNTFTGYPLTGIGGGATIRNNGLSTYYEDIPTDLNTGNVYMSFMLRDSTASTLGKYVMGLLPQGSTNTVSSPKVYIRRTSATGSTFRIGISKNNEVPTYTTDSFAFNTNFAFVFRYQYNTGASSNDSIFLYGFKTSFPTASAEPTTTATGLLLRTTGTGATDATSIKRIYLRQDTTSTQSQIMFVSGIRVGTSWNGLFYDGSNTFYAGVSKGTEAPVYAKDTFNIGAPTAFVLKYQYMSGSSTNDTVSLYAFKSGFPTAEPSPSNAFTLGGTTPDATTIGGVLLNQSDTLTSSALFVDGIRMATTWTNMFRTFTPFTGGGLNATGIYVNAAANVKIDNNIIRNTLPASADYRAILLTHDDDPGVSVDSNIQVTRNRIYNLNVNTAGGVSGIRIKLGSSIASSRNILVANNSIGNLSATASIGNSLTSYRYPIGILVDNTGASNLGLEMYFNTVNLYGSSLPAGANSACLVITSTVTGGVIMMNNSFSNTMGALPGNTTGYEIYNMVLNSATTPFLYSNFNNYFTDTKDGGGMFLAATGTASNRISSLRAFKTYSASDTLSITSIKPFTNDTLMLVADNRQHLTYNRGVALDQFYQFYPSIYAAMNYRVSNDINGTPRNNMGRFTSIGCHLWNGDSTNPNIGLVAPRVFGIKGFTRYPTKNNLNGSFSTLAEAITYMNAYGVSGSGDVVLEFQEGYDSDTTYLPPVIDCPGSGLGVQVILRAKAGLNITLSSPNKLNFANSSVLSFEGARWFTVDGGPTKNLSFVMPSKANTNNARVIEVVAHDLPSNDITIRNCKIIGNSTNNAINTSVGIYLGNPITATGGPAITTLNGFSNINFIGNEIGAVRTGIYAGANRDATNFTIQGNFIGGNIAPNPTNTAINTTYIGGAANQAGILAKGLINSIIDSNTIKNCIADGVLSNGFRGIDLDEVGAGKYFSNLTVSRNQIYNLNTLQGSFCTGIRFGFSAKDTVRNIQVQNNFISKITGIGIASKVASPLNPSGLLFESAGVQTQLSLNIAHNTIHLNDSGLSSAGTGCAVIYLDSNATTGGYIKGGVSLVNNILINRMGIKSASAGRRFVIYSAYGISPFDNNKNILPFAINNNAYYAGGNYNNHIAGFSATYRNNINDLRSTTQALIPGADGNSFNWPITFKNDTTPELNMISSSLVPTGAAFISTICNDVYGNQRYQCGSSSSLGRWIGALESGITNPPLQGGSTYYINGIDNPPTSFDPTVGSFKTVRSAVNYLNSQGVDGSFGGLKVIKLEITTGYVGETEKFTSPITVLDYPRMNTYRNVVLTSTGIDSIRVLDTAIDATVLTNASVIRFSGAKYFTIDGDFTNNTDRKLSIIAPRQFKAANNKVIDIVGGVDPIIIAKPVTGFITIKNLKIIGNSTSSAVATYAGIYSGGLITPSNAAIGRNDYITISNNFIGGVLYGIHMRGSNKRDSMDAYLTIDRNVIGGEIAPGGSQKTDYFGGTISGAYSAGIYLQGQSNASVLNNTIKNNVTTADYPRGIELATNAGYTALDSNCTISGNKIYNIISNLSGGAYGIFINYGSDTTNTDRNITVSNNMISRIFSLGAVAASTVGFPMNPFGIYVTASVPIKNNGRTDIGLKLYYNSINLSTGKNLMSSLNSISAPLGIFPNILGGIQSVNNIFQNRLSASVANAAYAVAIGGAVNPFSVSNYNNYFVGATSPSTSDRIGVNITTPTKSLYNQWYDIMSFTKQDTMSIGFVTPFVNDTNLFILDDTKSVIYGAGTPVFGVATDINGLARNFSNPSMGAHEFIGSYIDSVAPRIFNMSDLTSCFAYGINLSFRIYDKFNLTDTLYYRINGSDTINSLQAVLADGTLRTYAFPQIPGGSLLEYRISATDFKYPPNYGKYPSLNKVWDTLNISITNFPYKNGFEGPNNPIWTIQNVSQNATWDIVNSFGSTSNPPLGPYSGFKTALFKSYLYNQGASARLISPCLDFTYMKSPTLRFRVSQNSDMPTKNDSLAVTVTFGGGTFTSPLKTVRRLPDVSGAFNFPGWDLREVCLSEFAGMSGLRIAFEGYAAGIGQNIMLDDIEIFDDVQNQRLPYTVIPQCLKDSVTITIPSTDNRFNYVVFDMSNNTPLALSQGNGSNLFVKFKSPNVDTLITTIVAYNNISTSNALFVAGTTTCSNTLPDTVKVMINRFYNGPFLVAGKPFSGAYNAGTTSSPDGAKVGDTLTYQIVPPSNMSNDDYGTRWVVYTEGSNATAFVPTPFSGFQTIDPSYNGPGYIRVIAKANMLDTTYRLKLTYRLLESYCDSVIIRAFRVATPPTADFIVTPNGNKCALSALQFSAEPSIRPVINFPFSFAWQFGDNTSSIGINPKKTYAKDSTYTVKLFVTDRYGLVSVKEKTVTVLPSPIAQFTYATPCTNDSTLFKVENQLASTNYEWTFPGGLKDARNTPRYNFAKYDTTYQVSLTVTNTSGCTNTDTRNIYVFAKPTAKFTTKEHCFNTEVPLTNSSTIPTGAIGYAWNWGNGQMGLGATPNYKYPATGTYNVTLRAYSNFGCADSVTKTITVNDRPIVAFTTSNACKDDQISVKNNTSFSGGAQNLEYFWDFGDNTTSDQYNPSKVFSSTGPKTITLRATDILNGCKDSASVDVYVNYKPVASYNATPNPACVNNEVKIFNNSYTIDNSTYNCYWTFGTGDTSSNCNAGSYIYTTPGTYDLKLLVTAKEGGCSDTKTTSVTITNVPAIVVDTQYVDAKLYPYCDYSPRIKFSTNINDAVSYLWKFGDADSSTSKQPQPTFTYNDRGTFKASVTIEDASGCTISKQFTVYTDCRVGMQENIASHFNLTTYPNPFEHFTALNFELKETENVKIAVTDMLGRTVKATDFGKLMSGSHSFKLDDSYFGASGSYILKIQIGERNVYQSLIKQ